jgi:hypothetical protein
VLEGRGNKFDSDVLPRKACPMQCDLSAVATSKKQKEMLRLQVKWGDRLAFGGVEYYQDSASVETSVKIRCRSLDFDIVWSDVCFPV